ncbi:hypothetical protein L1889_04645 [Paenalcaligenes niemegkensis]|uniref:hypothetical protein n=1 Tax=Paenalcaligenes niemegkensis TaxID=2895469 RepID=UPI001EE7B1DA|nr:hypothetical protein [Paenalcaligenes niemegkensis]MCQ9616081.1 hypothetical protein [Paenalcaligenes niemegkensis]
MARLLGTAQEIDWVDSVCRKLPALAVMKGLKFSETDIDTVIAQVYPPMHRHITHSATLRRLAGQR